LVISFSSACLLWNNVLLSYWKGAICVTNCWSIGHHFCLSHLLLYSYALKCDKGLHFPYLTFFWLQGSYGCDTTGMPDKVCSDDRYLTVLMKKQELSHEGYSFLLELRIYSNSKYQGDRNSNMYYNWPIKIKQIITVIA